MMMDLQQATKQAAERFAAHTNDAAATLIDVQAELTALLHTDAWNAKQLTFFHGWMKKMDIAKAQYLHYDQQWKPGPNKQPVKQEHRQLSVLLALQYLHSSAIQQAHPGQQLKTINVLFKMLEQVEDVFGLMPSAVSQYLQNMLNNSKPQAVATTPTVNTGGGANKILPITVLFSEGPIARAYLEAIAALGLKVNKIIRLVSSVDLVSKKPVGSLLPKAMKVNYAANKQFKQMFYWPHHYQSKHAKVIELIQSQIQRQLSFDRQTLLNGVKNRDLQTHAVSVESLFVTGLKDAALATALSAEKDPLFLYTGGGIVPESLLNMAGKKLIHIHPGHLPEIRGADCVLWSQVLQQRMSASAFFMAPGIDVGDVLQACWLPQIHLNFPQQVDSRVKYRLIYGYLDPWVRAFVLQQLIHLTQGFDVLDTTPQVEDEGMTYHFMHEQLKKLAYDRFN